MTTDHVPLRAKSLLHHMRQLLHLVIAAIPTVLCSARASGQRGTLPSAATVSAGDTLATLAAAAPAPRPRPRVVVNRRELRLAFPVDTTEVTGWPATAPSASPYGYWWQLAVNSMDGPRWIWFAVPRDSTAREFASFSELLRTGRAELCQGGMALICSGSALRAFRRRD